MGAECTGAWHVQVLACTVERRVQGRGMYSGDLGIVDRIILKCILSNWGLGLWIGSSWLRTGTGASTCECGNEPSGV
jgi:hypothetical protein